MARMRKKKNLIPRTEACADHYFDVPQDNRGKWRSACGMPEDCKLFVEIGCGKGLFSQKMAEKYPDVCYVAIEREPSCCLLAMEKAKEAGLKNLFFIRGDAELINTYFAEGEIGRIYLNFSDPWPKERHARRRLPSSEYLRRYDRILAQGGIIEFKTDNRDLFDFAVEETAGSAFEIAQITYDLHRDPSMNAGNIMTEYEEKFSKKGNKICKYILRRRQSSGTE